MRRRWTVIFSLCLGIASFTTACAGTNVAPRGSNNPGDFKACLLTAGISPEGSVNALAIQGMEQARKQLGITIHTDNIGESDLVAPAVDKQVSLNCNLVIAVGDRFTTDIINKSKHYRDRFFALLVTPQVDTHGTRENIEILNYDLTQPAYLAGYYAAGTSRSGKVAVLGGSGTYANRQLISAFVQGVNKYNQELADLGIDSDSSGSGPVSINADEKGHSEYLGVNPSAKSVKNSTLQAIKQGADVIFYATEADPYQGLEILMSHNQKAKKVFISTRENNKEAGTDPNIESDKSDNSASDPKDSARLAKGKAKSDSDSFRDVTAIWYGSDGQISQKYYLGNQRQLPILTSVMPLVSQSVVVAIQDAKKHTFHLHNTQVIGDYSNRSVALAPFYQYEQYPPDAVKKRALKLLEGFRNGSLKVKPIAKNP